MLRGTGGSFAAVLAVSVPLTLLLWLSGMVAFPVAFVAMTLVVAVVLQAGRLLAGAADARALGAPGAWVLGVSGSSLAVYVLVAVFQVLAATAFVLWALVVAIWWWRSQRSEPAMDGEWLGLAACGVATLIWCREIAEAPQTLARAGVFPAWVDHFIHGGVISSFGDPRGLGRGSMELADFPARVYHYGSYMLPAVLAAPLDVPGLPLSTSAWVPIGFLTLCAGAWMFGATLAGRTGSIAALAALAALPDSSNYWPHNGFFSFQWNVLSLPGGAYAVGLGLAGFALLRHWAQAGSPRTLVAAACLAAGTALFRVQVFLLAFPAWLTSAAVCMRFVQRRKLAWFAAAAAAFALFVAVFYALTGAPLVLDRFLLLSHGYHEPIDYAEWYQAIVEDHGRVIAVPLGLVLVLVACLGIFTVLFPLVVVLQHRAGKLRASDAAPLALVVWYVLLMITAPIPTHGAVDEFAHRPFVLLYATVAAWTAAVVAGWLAPHAGAWIPRWRAVAAAIAVSMVALLWVVAPALAAPKFWWGWRFSALKAAPGLSETGAFLRKSSAPGQMFAVQGLSLEWTAVDVANELVALSGMPAYVARTSTNVSSGGERERTVFQRHAALRRVAEAETMAQAMALLRELRVHWYVVPDGKAPRWDPARRRVAFVAGSFAVYSVTDAGQPGR